MFRIGFSFYAILAITAKNSRIMMLFQHTFWGLSPRNMGSVPKMRCRNCGDGGDKRRTASRHGDVMKRPKRVLYLRRILSSVASFRMSIGRQAGVDMFDETSLPSEARKTPPSISLQRLQQTNIPSTVSSWLMNTDRCHLHPPHFDKSLMRGTIAFLTTNRFHITVQQLLI